MREIKFFLGLLILLSVAVPRASAQAPITNFSLLTGNSYFSSEPGHGDGSVRWAETRILYGGGNDYRLLSGGVFINYCEVGSKIDTFLFHDQEIAFGPAMNFGSQYWLESNEVWGWVNAGLKLMKDRGQIKLYETRQTDKAFYLLGGVMFKNSSGRGPFFIKKFMVTYQQPFNSTRKAYWNNRLVDSLPTNKGFVKLVAENTFCSLPLNTLESLRFEPKITGNINYEFYNKNVTYSLGVGLTLARQYSEEILILEGGIKFNETNGGLLYSAGIIFNIAQLSKAIFKKNNY